MSASGKWGGGEVQPLSTSGEGANSLLLRLHFSSHQSLLYCTLSPAIHFNGSNGTAYTRPSEVQNNNIVVQGITALILYRTNK
jgi:hypothetical protein